jgi:hypothetical protein
VKKFSPGTPVSSTTKTDRPDIAEILLKVALTTKNEIMLVPYIWFPMEILLSLATTNLNPCLLLNGDKKEFFLSKTLKSN